MRNIALVVVCCALMGGFALGENWPQFRGPTGQGISAEKNSPTKWSAAENVAWKTAIPGEAWSSPIVWEDRVFLTTATDNGVSCRVLCIDRQSGKILWNKEVFQQSLKRKEGKNSYATPTPITDGQRIYCVFGEGGIAALDFDGNIVWTNRDRKHYSQHGLGASPRLYKDVLIMPFDGSSEGEDKSVGWKKPWDQAAILALDKSTGQLKWQGKRGLSRIAHVTPLLVDVNGKTLLVSAAGDVVQGHDPENGQLIWTVFGQGEGVVPSIVAGEGLVFNASGFEAPTIKAVRPDGEGEVTKTHMAWQQKNQVPMIPSFILGNGLLFTIKESGFAMCLRPKTGEIVWQRRIGGNHSASPIFADGKIYFLSEEGESTIIDAGQEYREISRNSIGEKCQASYAVSQGQILIRSEKNLWCIGK